MKKKHKTSGVLFVRVEQKMLDELDAEAERLSAQAGGLATFDRSTVVRGILVAALAGRGAL